MKGKINHIEYLVKMKGPHAYLIMDGLCSNTLFQRCSCEGHDEYYMYVEILR